MKIAILPGDGIGTEIMAEAVKVLAVLDLNLFTETGGDINRVRKTSVGKVVMGSRFYEVQKYMTLTGHAYHTYAAVMNKNKWESLPEDLQTVVADAMIVGRDAARQYTDEDEAKILDAIKDQIEILPLTDEGRAAFIEASKPIYEEFAPKVTQELLDKAIAAAKG